VRIVVSHEQLVGFGGTESYALTVAEGLERLGHEVVVHTLQEGPSAEFARERGIRVESREGHLPAQCDAVLAQDAATAYALANRYPDAARVFVAHSVAFPLQSPPQAERACHAVVVMNDRLRRRTEGLAHQLAVVRLRQPIDLKRFCFQTLRLEQRRRPRVLLLSNYTKGTRARMIEQACAAAGLEVRRVGATTTPTPAPEHEIADAEIVLSLGRGALETMACGRAAYVFGDAGGDGWVTPETYPAIEADGFSGRALGEAIGVERLAADLAEWREASGELGRDLACAHHAADDHCLSLVELIKSLGTERPPGPTIAAELARLVRLEWSQNQDTRLAIARADESRGQVAALEAEVAALRAQAERSAGELERSEGELERLRGSRRHRFASLLAWPIDRYRARHERS
jgi:hypothetical protein